MNIKYITNVRIPTSRAQGYAIMKMCEEFANLGNNVELIVPDRQNNEPESDPFKYYGIKENFKIRKVWSTDLLGPYEAFGRLFYWIDMFTFLLSLSFSKVVSKDDVLYTRDYLVPLLFSSKKNICLELHDVPSSKIIFKYVLKKPKLFFVFKNIKKILVDLGVLESKIHVTPSGVDLKAFDIPVTTSEARSKLGLPQDKKIIVYTGHFYKWKGVGTLAEVARNLPEFLFIFIGGVDPELREFKEKYKNLKNIVELPFQARESMPLYLKASDVLVIPNSKESLISSEYTSPLKQFEYMASKHPMVVSDLPSLRVVSNDQNCIFAEPDNVGSFTESIKQAIENVEFSNKVAEKAYNDVQIYSWDKKG